MFEFDHIGPALVTRKLVDEGLWFAKPLGDQNLRQTSIHYLSGQFVGVRERQTGMANIDRNYRDLKPKHLRLWAMVDPDVKVTTLAGKSAGGTCTCLRASWASKERSTSTRTVRSFDGPKRTGAHLRVRRVRTTIAWRRIGDSNP